MPQTFSRAEADFEEILRRNDFMTASLKSSVKAPSIEDGTGFYVILPDIIAIDSKCGQGWCFEVKDETSSKAKMEVMQLGQTRPYGGGWRDPPLHSGAANKEPVRGDLATKPQCTMHPRPSITMFVNSERFIVSWK